MSYENALEIRGLNKEFKNFRLNGVDLILPAGSIMGFIGENGAGKTTTIKLILNQIKKDGGEIRIMGKDHLEHEMDLKKEIGVVLDQGFFYEGLSPLQIGTILSALYDRWDDRLYRDYLKRFQIPEKQAMKEFSKGMRMKLCIIAALSHHPKLLLLDEPTGGLDPVVRNEILDLFLDFIQDEEHSILFSTHITTDLEKIADYITFIHEGSILFTDAKDSVMEDYGLLKCSAGDFEKVWAEDHLGSRRTSFGCQALVRGRAAMAKKYPFAVVDPVSLEDIMLFYIQR